ncbi:uncharacterized protein LOC143177417 isoform X2 [Calliopsis andreniformis]|uniref:uncharacterized protein LOC143177417 isoform X2 n=1 Tax=Calliopsis andreniformis TaxID=337506 RepID=UPI003FCD9210
MRDEGGSRLVQRSKTCPQCREKVTQTNVNRLYFTFSNNETISSQSPTAQEKIDNLNFKILLKEKDIQYYTSKTVTLEKQNAGLRQEVYKVEREISKQNSMIYELKEEMKYCDELKKENAELKNKIEKLKPIQMLAHGRLSDVSEMIGDSKDPETLIKYISVMKKLLVEGTNKRKELRISLKSLQEDLTRVNTKCTSLLERQIELEEKLALSEGKNMSLQQRVDELEEILGINEKCTDASESQKLETKNDICNISTHEKSKRKRISQESSTKSSSSTKRIKEKICDTKDTDDKVFELPVEDDSFDLKVDLTNVSSSSDSSTTSKRNRMSSGNMNTLNNTSKSTKSIQKKKKGSTQTSVTENTRNGIIDLT